MAKEMKIARGTARQQRRANMGEFKKQQLARLADLARSTITYNLALRLALRHGAMRPPKERQQVATVTDEGGYSIVRMYDSSKESPNHAAEYPRELLHTYEPMTHGAALELAAVKNQ